MLLSALQRKNNDSMAVTLTCEEKKVQIERMTIKYRVVCLLPTWIAFSMQQHGARSIALYLSLMRAASKQTGDSTNCKLIRWI